MLIVVWKGDHFSTRPEYTTQREYLEHELARFIPGPSMIPKLLQLSESDLLSMITKFLV
ncbi:hypothetical protein GW846_05905 [Candidatus Gracilibacteria bacterium]|nr:hypothetical protein [Candidatus Gracilibacteria bacterium]